MKKFLNISLWVLLIAGLFAMVGFVEIEHKNLRCKHIDINIQRSDTAVYISNNDIYQLISSVSGDTLEGKPMKDLSIEKIRNAIRVNPYVASLIVYSTVDGILKVELTQRTPILRVINNREMNFYITGDGVMVPLCDQSTARVPVASGNISEAFVPGNSLASAATDSSDMAASLSTLQQLFVLADYLTRDPFFRAQIDQIYVSATGEFELVPRAGNHTIYFGDANFVKEKFENLLAFYKYGIKQTGWNHYKSINIKYRNQVICSKT